MLPASSPNRRDRPKGLWKARVMAFSARNPRGRQPPGSPVESDTDDDDASSTSSSLSDTQRRASSIDSLSDDDQVYYWGYSPKCSPYPDRVSNWATSRKIMDTSSTAGPGVSSENKDSCDYEDWEDLKELFAKATDQYENADASEALPILRGVIHECHRFLLCYPDPSELFLNSPQPPPATTRPVDEPTSSLLLNSTISKERKCKCVELPTTFHVILGTTLFLFGNLIAQWPSLALEGEPDVPLPYWFAALDVFETGENLPSRTDGRGGETPEDWRMAIVWGRTLVCIADESITRSARKSKDTGGGPSSADTQPPSLSSLNLFSADDPDWPPESPFAAIAERRPPITRRMTLNSSSPSELLDLAMDQFSRGIFHMPHPRHNGHAQNSRPPTVGPGAIAGAPTMQEQAFSRAKELFTIASEVLLLAEKLPTPAQRQQWASWADSVFNQMKMEADMDAWRGPINRARGRCWLIVGSACIDEIEAAMERGDMDLTKSEEAEEAREGLGKAVEFFERAKGSASMGALSDPEVRELQALLAEALLTLGNLTPDEAVQEDLYARAQLEGGEDYLMESQEDDDGDEMMNDA